jgi:hypothetical protein
MVWSKEASSIASINPLKMAQMRLAGSSASRPLPHCLAFAHHTFTVAIMASLEVVLET